MAAALSAPLSPLSCENQEDELRARGLPVEAVSFSLQGKAELRSRLEAAFEARRLTIPRLPDLLRELGAFESAKTPERNLTPHARRDDHVDSLDLGPTR